MTENKRIPVKEIQIVRREGPTRLCNKVQTAKSWKQANSILWRNSETAPKGGAYDKHDFKVLWEDGAVYDGRYDLQHHSSDPLDLAAHCRAFLRYLAGNPPAWMNEAQIESFEKERQANQAETEKAKIWLETLDFNQGG